MATKKWTWVIIIGAIVLLVFVMKPKTQSLMASAPITTSTLTRSFDQVQVQVDQTFVITYDACVNPGDTPTPCSNPDSWGVLGNDTAVSGGCFFGASDTNYLDGRTKEQLSIIPWTKIWTAPSGTGICTYEGVHHFSGLTQDIEGTDIIGTSTIQIIGNCDQLENDAIDAILAWVVSESTADRILALNAIALWADNC